MRKWAGDAVRGEGSLRGRCEGTGGVVRGSGRGARLDRDRAASRHRRAGRSVASTSDSLVVAEADSQIIGMLYLEVSPHGFGEISMHVDRDWRGRGVGSALMQAAIGLADKRSLHKLCLEVFAHNTAAIALYRKWGFVEEGRRARQYRRTSGELWDSIVMGLGLLKRIASQRSAANRCRARYRPDRTANSDA
jgi:ribosomal protein S18 acetylase RimI-like enzyme